MPGATDDLTSIPVQLDASTSIDRPVQIESSRSSSAPTRWLAVAGILAALAAAAYVANRLRGGIGGSVRRAG
jgi:hypothetical protein